MLKEEIQNTRTVLAKLQDDTNRILENAERNKKLFGDEFIEWGLVLCSRASAIYESDELYFAVAIDGLDNFQPLFKKYIAENLVKWGWKNIMLEI